MPAISQWACCLLTVLAIQAAIQIEPCQAAPLAVTPFYTFNQSPLVQIFGLPAAESALIQKPGHLWSLFADDVANDYGFDGSRHDLALLDGESYRMTLALRYGITDKLELGADLPFVGYYGGILDGMIENWHSIFGLSQGGRLKAPRDRLLFTYTRDGQELLSLDRSSLGLGDIRLSGGWQLYDGGGSSRALALRASLKLPTGSSSDLHGSGSTDLALWLTGSNDNQLGDGWGHLTFFAAGGAMGLTNGRVLEVQQNNLVGFGTLGLGWAPRDWYALKTQISVHSPFFNQSSLPELGQPAVQLIFGGTLGFSPKTALDIALSEDANVAASPDLAIHLGLSHQF